MPVEVTTLQLNKAKIQSQPPPKNVCTRIIFQLLPEDQMSHALGICIHTNAQHTHTHANCAQITPIQSVTTQGPPCRGQVPAATYLSQGKSSARGTRPPPFTEGSHMPVGPDDSFGFTPLACLFQAVMCFPETHTASLGFC